MLTQLESGRVAVKVRVHVHARLSRVELVHGDAGHRPAVKFGDGTVVDSADGRAARRHDVQRIVRPHAALFVEVVTQGVLESGQGEYEAAGRSQV